MEENGLSFSGQYRTYRKRIRTNSKEPEYCTICGCLLDNLEDPLSGDAGGDCWGCIGAIEAEMGCAESLAYVRKEYEAGLRPAGSIHSSPDLEAALRPLWKEVAIP